KTLFNAVLGGEAEVFQAELSKILAESISYHDSAENFYHGFMAGILSRLNGYRVKSNRESGDGRSDLVLYGMDKAVIFELKMAEKFKEMPALCEDALRQIEERNYAAYWDDEGYTNIVKYGVAFYKKRCEVRKR
ncbi:MAG: PD-(D/E)XK nuclease domain-containing protein, partial [Fibromonadales bacterium]|nr:PD-(D/E)XK nuclease domain-containing protein [Fibromonadales bacterium]